MRHLIRQNRRFLTSLALMMLVVVTACTPAQPAATPTPTDVPREAIKVKFAYANSAQAWFQPMIDQFNGTRTLTPDGKQIVVVGTSLASGAMIETMAQGNAPYDLIAPADKVWVDILAARRNEHGDTALSIGACTSVARSPVVLITWRSMAEVLGWPDREFTWHDVAELALSPSAWQGYDHPEWGTLTFAHAHPLLSQGGLAALLGESYAAAPLTLSDVQSDNVKSYLRVVERSVARYGSDTGSMIKNMADKGQRYLHVAVGYESDVIANHQGDDGLIAIYPKETFVADYATCVIGGNGPASQFAQYLLTDSAQQAALGAGLRPVSKNVTLSAPIDPAHGVDPAAKYQTLPMPSVDVIRTVQDAWGALKRSLNVVLVIDVSGSMQTAGKIDGARTGAAAFIDRLGNDDMVTVYTFSTHPRLLVPQARIGDSRARIQGAISELKPDAETALYAAIAQARAEIKPDSRRINAIVVLTDGQDTSSKPMTLNSLLELLKKGKGGVTIYTIGYGRDADQDVLAQIADAANGSYFAGDPATINQVYLEIASQFGGSRGLGR